MKLLTSLIILLFYSFCTGIALGKFILIYRERSKRANSVLSGVVLILFPSCIVIGFPIYYWTLWCMSEKLFHSSGLEPRMVLLISVCVTLISFAYMTRKLIFLRRH